MKDTDRGGERKTYRMPSRNTAIKAHRIRLLTRRSANRKNGITNVSESVRIFTSDWAMAYASRRMHRDELTLSLVDVTQGDPTGRHCAMVRGKKVRTCNVLNAIMA